MVYVGAAGSDNLGDRAMFQMVQSLLPSVRWIASTGAAWERRLSAMGLSGGRYFSVAVLGGGTMMNAYSESIVESLLESGTPFVSLGTGAGSGGWDLPPGYDLLNWTRLLHRFQWVTIRGPRTKRALEEARFSAATVIGDLALGFTKPSPTPLEARPRRLCYNLIQPHPGERWNPNAIEALGRALAGRARMGWEIVPFAMQPSDRAACEALVERHGLTARTILQPTSGWQIVDMLERASIVISMRLHGAVFAAAAGAPVVSLGYLAKCNDFMESVGAGDALLPVDVAGTTAAILERLEERIAWAVEHAADVHGRALAHAHEIEKRVTQVGALAVQPRAYPR